MSEEERTPEYEVIPDSSLEDTVTVDEVIAPSALKNDVRYSGECGSCRKRINDVPVIDGAPQCPNCNSV